jgi:hypothetical protein
MVREFRAQGLIPNTVSLTTYGRELEVLHADAPSGELVAKPQLAHGTSRLA